MTKKSIGRSGVRIAAGPTPVGESHRPQRPWLLMLLMLLGAAAIGLVFFVQLVRPLQSSNGRAEDKVYSAAADTFDGMVAPTTQTGLLEPPGVAKPLHLFGVKTGGSPKEGLAILGAAEASSRTYVAGALLENGARLAELYPDHVVLIRDGQRYTLYMPQKGKGDALAAKSSSRLTVGGFKTEAPPATAPAVRVSDAIRVAPAYEGGEVVGFQVYPGAKPGQMERWGLASGDVLVSLAGQPLSTSEQLESVMEELAQGASIDGEIRRGEARLPVTLDGSMLVASTRSEPPPPPMP
jgi:type II secretion system protein C